jgi:hypothetical protein
LAEAALVGDLAAGVLVERLAADGLAAAGLVALDSVPRLEALDLVTRRFTRTDPPPN